jgi:hypothetical protein
MSTQGVRVVNTDALPPNKVSPLEAGTSNVFQSAAMKSTNADIAQNTLINGSKGQNGGIKKHIKHFRGGNSAPVVVVSSAPSYDPNQSATNANNTKIAILANDTASKAALDIPGGSPAESAAITASQQKIYYGKGGSKTRRKYCYKSAKKGGNFPKWSCLSGGQKSQRLSKKNRYKKRKTRRCKARKNCKHLIRYR